MRSKLAVMVAAVLTVGVFAGIAAAQDGQSSGLQVSPTRTELVVEAGASTTFEVDVKNVTPGIITTKTTVDDFEPGEDGTPRLLPLSEEVRGQSVRQFIKGIEDFSLNASESKKAAYTVEIPAGQAPGAYYGVVRYQAVPGTAEGDGGGQVALTASIGHIVLIQVPGNITESMQLVSVKAERGGKTGSLFSAAPDKIRLEVKNTGNSFLKPFGTVSIEKGGKELYSYQINDQEQKANVLPNSNRVFKGDIKEVSGFGRYKVVANIAYSQGGEVLTTTSVFWVVPIWLAIVVAVAALVVIGAVVWVVRRFKNR